MILYHGTNKDFTDIDITKSNPYKDFGKGFYLTDIREQALRMADRKVNFFGGTPVLQTYEFKESLLTSSNLNIKIFENPTEEWARFIHQNRNRTEQAQHDYDIVIGPIADDGVAFLLGRYEEGTITLSELARQLEFKRLNRQFFFGSEKAIQLLKRINDE